MNKENKLIDKTFVLGTLLCLVSSLIYLPFYNTLPEPMPVHFGSDGVADGFMSKAVAVFLFPLIFVALNSIVAFSIRFDPKSQNVSPKLKLIVRWLIPLMSLVVNISILFYAIGLPINIGIVAQGLVGFVFIVIGNYLPACKQSYTVGIRLPWTLNSEENWVKTHRLGGYCFIIAGLLMLINIALNWTWLLFAAILLCMLIPMVCSFILYKKGI